MHYNLVTINSKERNVKLALQGKTWAQTTQCAQCEGSKHHDTHPKPYWCMDGLQSEGKKKELWWQSNKKQEKISRRGERKILTKCEYVIFFKYQMKFIWHPLPSQELL